MAAHPPVMPDDSTATLKPELRDKLARGLALFDFDGTLVPWDTQVVFAHHVLKKEPARRLYLSVFAALSPAASILGDEGMKRVFLSYLWKARPAQVRGWAREWVESWLPGVVYQEVREALERHRAAGHLTVLASASPEFYVAEVGRVLGFDLALGTRVELDGPLPLFPDLVNHKGVEKVRRLSEIIGPPPPEGWEGSHGYTDSRADLPMMLACREGTVVNPSPALTGIAAGRGWHILRPPVPWKSRLDKVSHILRFAAGIHP